VESDRKLVHNPTRVKFPTLLVCVR